ncbi:MAG: sulfite exporter TauE/SafE family protein, partial [Burkholderiales bacterium]
MYVDILYTISGFIVGFIVGLTGVGGGSLMTPLLVLLFGIAPATAVGTDLLYAAITKMGGVWVHGRRSNVNWNIVGRLTLGSLPASLITVW